MIKMPIVLVRLDDRLIHGQVTVKWAHKVNPDRIIVVNDQVAQDPIAKMTLPLAAPAGVKVSILSVNDAVSEHNSNKWDKEKVFIIVKTPFDALGLVKGGVRFDWLDVGQLGYKEGRKHVTRTVSLSEDEAKALKEVSDMGIKLIYQQLPEDKAVNFLEIIKKHFNL